MTPDERIPRGSRRVIYRASLGDAHGIIVSRLRGTREVAITAEIESAFCCCTACIVVIDAEKIDQSWSTYTLSRRYRMSTLDEITKEKQRVSEALTRVDAQRETLTGQLSELEAMVPIQPPSRWKSRADSSS